MIVFTLLNITRITKSRYRPEAESAFSKWACLDPDKMFLLKNIILP